MVRFRKLLLNYWPSIIAVVFSALTITLVFQLYVSQTQLRSATDARLVADNQHRAASIADFLTEQQRTAEELAKSHEIDAYLTNLALGMSPKYGLNTNLEAIDQRLRREIEQKTLRGEVIYSRIEFIAEDGSLLAEAGSGETAKQSSIRQQGKTQLSLDSQNWRLVVSAPIVFKGTPSGTLVTISDLRLLSHLLVSRNAPDLYQELLLTSDGSPIPTFATQPSNYPKLSTQAFAKLPESQLISTANIPDAEQFKKLLVLRTAISGTDISVLTLISEADAYGKLGSPALALLLGCFTAALLLAAFGFEKMRQRAESHQAKSLILDRQRDELEEIVSARTRELSLAKVAAESANLAKSTFLANMSHELRTPMNAIIGLTHMLGRQNIDPGQNDKIAKINSSAQHLLDLVNEILDLSKIEAQQMRIEQTPFSLSNLLSELDNLLSGRAEEKGLSFIQSIDPQLATQQLIGDPLRLRQVLINLMSNAIKFTEQGGVTLNIQIKHQDGDHAVLHFSVMDTGVGISNESLGLVFDPFVQADGSTTRQFGGTGLGLAICKHLITMMGGQIEVSSSLGKGTEFSFQLTFNKAAIDAGEAAETTHICGPEAEQQIIARHRGKRVLLAEDDWINQEVAKELLEAVLGLSLDIVDDGAKALDRVQKNDYALVLMDMQMPVMGGIESARQIRQIERLKNLPIIAMTANAFAEDEQNCRAAGMNDFVAKPVDPDILFVVLLKWLEATNHP